MKTIYSMPACILSALLTQSAVAQSATTLYGVVDTGITYLSNSGGHSSMSGTSSVGRPSVLGLRGSEDLGEGLSSIFTLETQIVPGTGRQLNNSTFWGREASVGLTNRTWGTLKLGRMPDLSFTDLGILDGTPLIQGGMQSGYTGFSRPAGQPGPPPPVDFHYGGAVYNNAIKWVNDFGPVRVGLMHSRGDASGDRMYGAMVRYTFGGFTLGAAYTKDNFTTAVFARQAFVVKAQYFTGPFIFVANYGVGKDTTSHAQVRPLELAVQYAPDFRWRLGIGFGYAWATNAVGEKARIQQPFAGVKYVLSKRTELYAVAARNHTSDPSVVPATVSTPGGAFNVSSSNVMSAVTMGITHSF